MMAGNGANSPTPFELDGRGSERIRKYSSPCVENKMCIRVDKSGWVKIGIRWDRNGCEPLDAKTAMTSLLSHPNPRAV